MADSSKTTNIIASSGFDSLPLCYPNNYVWDAGKRKLTEQKGVARENLVVCKDAITFMESAELKNYPVCVVAIAGDRRTGKSYILSQLQDPPRDKCIFDVSPSMKANTIGIWMNGNIFLKTLRDGTEAAVILLDTEGLDSIDSMGKGDDPLFTLTLLISSVLIYNTNNVPRANDLQKLRFLGNLATKIGVKSKPSEESQVTLKDADDSFRRFFPIFLWLLRDATLKFETPVKEAQSTLCSSTDVDDDDEDHDDDDYNEDDDDDDDDHDDDNDDDLVQDDSEEIKMYFLKEVLKGDIGKTILSFFPEFRAFKLPPPSFDEKVVQNLSRRRNRRKINKKFISKVEILRENVYLLMLAKNAWPQVGKVSVLQFAKLVTKYVEALNTPGTIPNVMSTWDQVLDAQLEETVANAVELYKTKMDALIEKLLPCEETEIREKHTLLKDESLEHYKANSTDINDAEKKRKSLKDFQDKLATYHDERLIGGLLKTYLDRNYQQSLKHCQEIAEQLLTNARESLTREKCSSFTDVDTVRNGIVEEYEKQAKGPCMTPTTDILIKGVNGLLIDNLEWIKDFEDYTQIDMDEESKLRLEKEESLLELRKTKSKLADAEDSRRQLQHQKENYEKDLETEREGRKADVEHLEKQVREQRQLVKELQAKLKTAEESKSKDSDFPWLHIKDETDKNKTRVSLIEGSDEYKEVEARFRKNVDKVKIVGIERVQNCKQYTQYVSLRKEMEKEKGSLEKVNEQTLYHGTLKERVRDIVRERFDRGYAGTGVGANYGNACYFAMNSGLPLQSHCKADNNGIKWMFEVTVLVGEYTQGVKGIVNPPYKDEEADIRYDSIADNVAEPRFIGTFTDYQAYPKYIISFTGGKYKP